jgi:2-succinyl-5-enolpyruvyl-6-hydroxy-3-cyclohexene-1-carboxylate synthase
MEGILAKHQIVLLPDVTLNTLDGDFSSNYWLAPFIQSIDREQITPDVLITFGGQINTKSLKEWLRKMPIQKHIHLCESEELVDTYHQLTDCLPISIEDFFKALEDCNTQLGDESYYRLLQNNALNINLLAETSKAKLLSSEAGIFHRILDELPSGAHLHLGNSLTIRYLVEFPYHRSKFKTVSANRGTSGIDGCLSTAVGIALALPNENHYLILGDLSFMYDAHGLYHIPTNLTVFILNNYGGNIFKHIDGPKESDILESYFVAKHQLDFEGIAKHHSLNYTKIIIQENSDFVFNLDKNVQLYEVMIPESYHTKSIRILKSELMIGYETNG